MSKEQGISLGWNCSGSTDGVRLGLRDKKEEGYNTCPFDMMISNYIGLCECIEDDFKYFCDRDYLELREAPNISPHIPNQKEGEMWIYNTKYNFTFNHEAPGHGNLYMSEKWVGGIDHFVINDFENFIERYNRRIENFRTYLRESSFINFIIWRYNSLPIELVEIIQRKYPNLDFRINTIINFGPHTTNCLINKSNIGGISYETDYLRYMRIEEETHKEEYERYHLPYRFDIVESIPDRISIIDPKIDSRLW
jgi:hypothetical protein